MDKGIRIGQVEFFALFTLARLFGSLTYVGEGSMPIDTSTALLGHLCAALLAWGAFGLVTGLVRLAGTQTPVQLCFLTGKPSGRAATALLGGCSFLVMVQVINSFERYFTSTVYPEASGFIFILWCIAVLIFFNVMGLDALSRMSNLLLLGLVLVLIVVTAGLWSVAEPVELISPFYEGPMALLSSIYRSFVDWGDLIVMAMMLPMVGGGGRRAARGVFGAAIVVAELISVLVITVLGGASRMQLYPVHALFSAADIWVPTRVDFLFMMLFMTVCLLKGALHLAFVDHALKTLLPVGRAQHSLGAAALTAGVAAFALSRSHWLTSNFIALMNSGAPMLLMTLIIPLLWGTAALLSGRHPS